MSSSEAAFSNEELLAELRELETQRCALAAREHALIVEAHARDLAATLGARSVVSLLSQLLRITPGEAKARVTAAGFLVARRMITGQVVPPLYPLVAQAQVDGAINASHARVIVDVIERLPEAARADGVEEQLEVDLVAWAREFEPGKLAQLAKRVVDTLDPDGLLKDVEFRHRRRYLDLHRRSDGSAHLEGELDVEAAEYLDAALTALSAPKTHHGAPDPRSPGQRRHDALTELVQTAMRAGSLPSTSGVTTTVTVVASLDSLVTGNGLVRVGSGTLIPVREATRWFGSDTRFFAVLLDRAKKPVSYSTGAARLFGEAQRLAMAARDGGCFHPGCTAPPSRCEAHHIVDFAKGGPTAVANGVLLCRFHHHHFAQLGWECGRGDDELPEWVPPAWIDPTRTPRRNTAHNQ